MKSFLINFTKTVILWVAILVSSIIATNVLKMSYDEIVDGPLTAGQAFFIVNFFHALMLSIIAHNARVKGLSLMLLIGSTLFVAQSFLLLLEAFYFIDDLKITASQLIVNSGQVLIISTLTGAFSALLWRKKKLPITHNAISISSLPLRIFLIALVYVVAYFIAGNYIAWASRDVQTFYSFGQDIKLLPLLLFQLFRGSLWGLLALYISTSLNGSYLKRSLIVGGSFSIFAIAQLLYPNIYMPWEVRLIHIIEVGISNSIFGVAAVLILFHSNKNSVVMRS